LHVLPVLIRKIDADGRESILRPVDESQPHRKVTVRYVRPKPVVDKCMAKSKAPNDPRVTGPDKPDKLGSTAVWIEQPHNSISSKRTKLKTFEGRNEVPADDSTSKISPFSNQRMSEMETFEVHNELPAGDSTSEFSEESTRRADRSSSTESAPERSRS
jgi:hypothetical protein